MFEVEPKVQTGLITPEPALPASSAAPTELVPPSSVSKLQPQGPSKLLDSSTSASSQEVKAAFYSSFLQISFSA